MAKLRVPKPKRVRMPKLSKVKSPRPPRVKRAKVGLPAVKLPKI
jgi:hypothetical protein